MLEWFLNKWFALLHVLAYTQGPIRRLRGWLDRRSERMMLRLTGGCEVMGTLTLDDNDRCYVFAAQSDGLRLIHWPGKDAGASPFPEDEPAKEGASGDRETGVG